MAVVRFLTAASRLVMLRPPWFFLCIFILSRASAVQAQHSHFHSHHEQQRSWQTGNGNFWSVGTVCTPVADGHPIGSGTSFGVTHHVRHRGYVPVVVGTGPVWFPNPAPPVVPTISVIPVVHKNPAEAVLDPAKRPAKPSTPAGRLKSLEYQARGDEKLRKQLWAQAYLSYRSAVDAAGDQGEGHFRLGFVYTAMQYYPSAIREFKRGLFLSPDIPASGIRLPMLFGPDSEIVRTSILSKVADWVREDSRDSDRLFLLGLLLHHEDDPRRREVLQAARNMAGGLDDHIVALLAQPDVPAAPGAKTLPLDIPQLPEAGNPVPIPPDAVPLLNPAPVGLPHVGPPQPPPPIGLPPLFDRPAPPVLPAQVVGKP